MIYWILFLMLRGDKSFFSLFWLNVFLLELSKVYLFVELFLNVW